MALDGFLGKAVEVVAQVAKQTQIEVDALPKPEVDKLNLHSALQMCAAVAVDAGQSLFGGALRMAGIAVFQVASSDDTDEPKTYPFWIAPSLPDDQKRAWVDQALQDLAAVEPMIQRFVSGIGWCNAAGGMQPGAYDSAAAVADYVRDLLEWSELFRLAKVLDETRRAFSSTQPILLRDGALRFGSTAGNIAKPLGKLFNDINVPIFGVTKQSALLGNPVIRLWLKNHAVTQQAGAFCVWLQPEHFQDLGWHIERYFGKAGFRFGRYAIVRFDAMPGSEDLFAVDIPEELFLYQRPKVLELLSGLVMQVAATAYPWPGYPIVLRKAHNKVVVTEDRSRTLESSMRRLLPPDSYEFLKTLVFPLM